MNKKLYQKYNGRIYNLVYEDYDYYEIGDYNHQNRHDNIAILNTIFMNGIYLDNNNVVCTSTTDTWTIQPLMYKTFSRMMYKKDDAVGDMKDNIWGVFYG